MLEKLSTTHTDTFNKVVFSFLGDIVPYTKMEDGSEHNIIDSSDVLTEAFRSIVGDLELKEENCVWLANYATKKIDEIKNIGENK